MISHFQWSYGLLIRMWRGWLGRAVIFDSYVKGVALLILIWHIVCDIFFDKKDPNSSFVYSKKMKAMRWCMAVHYCLLPRMTSCYETLFSNLHCNSHPLPHLLSWSITASEHMNVITLHLNKSVQSCLGLRNSLRLLLKIS